MSAASLRNNVCDSIFGSRPKSDAAPLNNGLERVQEKFPRLHKAIQEAGFESSEDFFHSVTTPGFVLQQAWKWAKELQYQSISRRNLSAVGQRASNVALRELKIENDGKFQIQAVSHLFDGCKAGEQILVNFGSLTCPIFRNASERMAKFEKAYPQVQFKTVYITEAHPMNWWEDVPRPAAELSDNEGQCFPEPRTIVERARLASYFLRDEGKALSEGHIYLDLMTNEAREHFQAWPIRLYLVEMMQEDEELVPRIVYKGDRGPTGYDLRALCEFLESQENPVAAE